jgi:hypothetical protein
MKPLKTEFLLHKISVRTSQEPHHVSATKPNGLMLSRETVAVYCENHNTNTRTLCGHTAVLWYLKEGGTYINQCALKG